MTESRGLIVIICAAASTLVLLDLTRHEDAQC